MPYQPIPGTRVGVYTEPKKKDITVACPRCGHRRQPNHNAKQKGHKISGLCRDCRYVLSAEEIEIWSRQSTEAA